MNVRHLALSTSLLATAACGDNIDNSRPDSAACTTGCIDAAIDATVWNAPAAASLGLSAAGHDRVMSVVASADDKFYLAGFSSTSTSADKHVVVMRLLSDGMPDHSFGTAGVFDTNVVFKGSDDEIDIVHVTGGVLISATVAAASVNALDAADTDIALIKVTAAGALDTNFGGGDGVYVHSLNTSALTTSGTPAPFGRDLVRGLAVRTSGEIFIHGAARANGTIMGTANPRQDTDFVVAKFLADGSDFDDTFSADGMHEQDIYYVDKHLNATPRGLVVLDDGALVASGYAGGTTGGNGGPTEGPQPVLFRLTAAGALDTNFAPTSTVPGLSYGQVLTEQAEVYNIARHGNNIVTGGYGRNDSTDNLNDWVSFRYDATTGARDLTWGGVAEGKVLFDPTPLNKVGGSNCRNAIALPNGKTLLLGSSNRDVNNSGSMPRHQDAVFAVLDANGALDPTYGTGIATYTLGDDGADAFWGGAANSTHALIVGWRATVGTADATNNDDSYRVLLPL